MSIFRRGPSTADRTLAHFEVSDIAATIGELEAPWRAIHRLCGRTRCRPPSTSPHWGPARAAWFRDPDGNTLGLRQG